MTEAEISLRTAPDVVGWRERQLAASGFPSALAAAAAADERLDLHALIELTERGCPPHVAVRIQAPLESVA